MQHQLAPRTAVVLALGLLAVSPISGCGAKDQASAPTSPQAAAAAAAASGAEASAAAANTSASLARARVPAAGTVSNRAGQNQQVPPPSVTVSEQAQAAGDEAPQELREKVNAAKDAGTAPKK